MSVDSKTWTERWSPIDRIKRLDREAIIGISTISPTILIFLGVVLVPTLYSVYASLHQIHALNPVWEWAQLGNYETILANGEFYEALGNGVVYTIGSVVVQIVIGVGVALLLNKVKSRLVTSASLALYVIPTIVIVFLFRWMLDERYGLLINYAIDLGVISSNINVWAAPTLAMAGVILVGSYKFSIFITIMVLARLQSIPSSHYEAATMGGATTLQRFSYITWPQIRSVVALVVLLRGLFMFNKFDVIWMTTQGGPNGTTLTLPIWAYQVMFEEYAYGTASAIAVLMFLTLAVGGVIYFGVFKPEQDIKEVSQ